MASKNWVKARIKRIIGPAAGAFGNIDELPAAQPRAGFYYADDGNWYEDPQTAIDNADHYVSLGCEAVDANLTITTEGFTLECMSEQAAIDGTDQGPAITVDAADVDLRGFSARTDAGSGNPAVELTNNASDCDVENVTITEAGGNGILGASGANEVEVRECEIDSAEDRAIDLAGTDNRIEACYALGGTDDGLRVQGDRSAIVHSYSLDHGNDGIEAEGDDSRVNNNTVEGVSDNGLLLQGDDSICNANIVINNGGDGIVVQGTNDVVTSNRSGGNTGTNLNTSGATTPTTDNNNTGPLN